MRLALLGLGEGRTLSRLYTPLVTAVLVLVGGNWWAHTVEFDALTVSQNERLRFQADGDAIEAARVAGLSAQEAALADAAMQVDRRVDGARPILMYTGNSQSMGIMDRVAGDMTSPQWLQVLLARASSKGSPVYDVRVASMPNITASEILIKLVAATEGAPRQVDVLLVACVLEEFRGLGLRDALKPLLTPRVRERLGALLAANPDLDAAAQALTPVISADEAQHEKDAQDPSLALRLDALVNDGLDVMPLFAHRDVMQGVVGAWWHEARNHLLGITSATLRPVPKAAYQASLQLLELTLREARAQGVPVALYLVPLRPVKPNPNDPRDVEAFRRDVPALAQRYGAVVMDFTELIAEELWTNYGDEALGTGGQRDFAHFTGKAHKQLAEALMRDLAGRLGEWAGPKGTAPR